MTNIPVQPTPAAAPVATAASAPVAAPVRRRAPRRPLSGAAHFFLTIAGVVAGLFAFFILLALLISFFGALAAAGNDEGLSGDTILSLDLRGGLADSPVPDPLFGTAPGSTVQTVRAIHAAIDDDAVEGMFVRGPAGLAPSSAQEVSEALEAFRDSGKFVVGFAQGFDSSSVLPLVAMSETELWMQGSTSMSSAGIQVESQFLRGTLELIDADPEMVQFYEYKTAADTYDETGFTEAGREATQALVDSLYGNAVQAIADARGLSRGVVEAALREAPLTAERAVELGLVDELGQLEDARQRARELTGDADDATFLSVSDYDVSNPTGAPVIAFIGGQGAVVTGEAGGATNPLAGNTPAIASDTIARAFDAASEADNVRAIIFRVSSPGGSPAASDQIHAAVARAKERGKPVIVSMGPYAASGGYYVSANADHILAMPSTITGSIGVLGGKIAFGGTFDRVGLNIEQVEAGGPYVGAFSLDTPFSDYQEAAWTRMLADTYEDFTTVVAEGRDIPIEDVLEVAKGRVWTGEQALERNLVDELGGIMEAIEAAKLIAEIDADTAVRLRTFPKQLSTEEQFLQLLSASAKSQEDLAEVRALLDLPEVRAMLDARAMAEPKVELRAVVPEFD